MYLVPGPVSDPSVQPGFPIVLTWGAPREPNGEIVGYEVSYTVDGDEHTTDVELNTLFTIQGLHQEARITNITITTYTSAGPGKDTRLPNMVFLGNGELLFCCCIP